MSISGTLFNIESLSRTLSIRFEPLYTIMYYVGSSDGAVLCYALKLEIYVATSVHKDINISDL